MYLTSSVRTLSQPAERAPQLVQPPPAHRLEQLQQCGAAGLEPACLPNTERARHRGRVTWSRARDTRHRPTLVDLSTYRVRNAPYSDSIGLPGLWRFRGAQRYRHCGSVPWEKWRQTDRQRHRGRSREPSLCEHYWLRPSSSLQVQSLGRRPPALARNVCNARPLAPRIRAPMPLL